MAMIGEVTPVLFVGLGGAGGRVVGRLARVLRGKWDASRYEKLTKFVIIDTDASAAKILRQGKEGYGPVDKTFVISDFDKAQYASLIRGEGFATSNPYLTQWIYPDYRFREGDTAGAGQIRIEARLGQYHALETSDMYLQLLAVVNQLRDHVHTAASADQPPQAHIVFSVAGGTGSGTFLILLCHPDDCLLCLA